MARKTNKTSHVLNLITGGTAPQEENPSRVNEDQNQEAAPAPSTEQKVVVVDSSEDEKISDDIRRHLLNELNLGNEEKAQGGVSQPQDSHELPQPPQPQGGQGEEELPQPQGGQEEEEPPQPQDSRGEEEQPQPQDSHEPPQAQQDVQLEIQSSREAQESPEQPQQQPVSQPELSYRMINVMEEIIDKDTVRAEMEKYGVCMCSRCQADVLALLLTRLPAKYVVADRAAASPLLSYYKNRFRVNLLTQTIKACMDVKDNPRHERKLPYDLSKAVDN